DQEALKHPDVWEKVSQNLRAGDMPPSGKPKPSAGEMDRILKWIETTTTRVDCTKQYDPGRVTIRRLNRIEYRNTIRDLVGIDFKPAEDFPADDVGYGFYKIGDVFTLSPLLVEKYLDAADKIVRQAFDDPKIKERLLPPRKKKFTPEKRGLLVRQAIENFARRAYRRPISEDEFLRLRK